MKAAAIALNLRSLSGSAADAVTVSPGGMPPCTIGVVADMWPIGLRTRRRRAWPADGAPEVADERSPPLAARRRALSVCRRMRSRPARYALGERRRPRGIPALAHAHRVECPLWRRLQHHEGAVAGSPTPPPGILDPRDHGRCGHHPRRRSRGSGDAARTIPARGAVPSSSPDADRGEACRRMEVGAHRRAEREIGDTASEPTSAPCRARPRNAGPARRRPAYRRSRPGRTIAR